jgi:Reverse transcriptase (RNA-dependent DNA polymerase)
MDTMMATGKTMYQVFLDLSKAYDTVDREKQLLVLEQYGVGEATLRILRNFWDNLWVIPKQGVFYGKPFRSERGVTQGDPLSPTLINIIVDVVVRETRRTMMHTDNDSIFYADDGLITGTDKEKVQDCVNLVTDLFSSFGLMMNPAKTKSLVGSPTIKTHSISTPAFNRGCTGEGRTYASINREQIPCEVCGKTLQRKSMKRHLLTQHDLYCRPTKRHRVSDIHATAERTYNIYLPNGIPTDCPVPLCTANYKTRDSMRTHFQHRHWKDTIIIEEEGPLPRCNRCLMFTRSANTDKHYNTQRCQAGTNRAQRRQQQADNEVGEDNIIYIRGVTIERVDSFRYLGRILTATGDDSLTLQYNLNKARHTWRRISPILRREGADKSTSGNFYKAIIQSVLLYGSESWHYKKQSIKALTGFHQNVARLITNKQPRRVHPSIDVWLYSNADDALEEANLLPLESYIIKRKSKLLHWAQNREHFHTARRIERLMSQPGMFWGPPISSEPTDTTTTTTTTTTALPALPE